MAMYLNNFLETKLEVIKHFGHLKNVLKKFLRNKYNSFACVFITKGKP